MATVKPNKVVAMSGTAKLMPAGKQAIANSMYLKGRAFLGAAFLTSKISKNSNCEATEYVFLYLLCQGIEVSLKGLLLRVNYDKYKSRLKPGKKIINPLGHDLVKTAEESLAAFQFKRIDPEIKTELEKLTKLYSEQRLRYGDIHDIFVAPSSIARTRIIRRIAAVIRLADRELREPHSTT